MIEIENVSKSYGKTFVLRIPYLHIREGSILGLVGNNGAGKTTLFRAILDLIPLDRGTIKIGGEIVTNDTNWKKYTAAYLDETFLIDFLKPLEYFDFIASVYKINMNNYLSDFKDFLFDDILSKPDQMIRYFSNGNKQKIGIIGALLTHPKVLILDEPFSHLDPRSQILLKSYLQNLNSKYQTTILLSSHNIEHVFQICTRIVLLENGKLIQDISPTIEEQNNIIKYFVNNI